jgi:D-aminopeptidase
MRKFSSLLFLLFINTILHAQPKPRARDLGIPFDGITGRCNAITDVEAVLVGYKTIITAEGKLETGKGPVRTGVTIIFPNGKSIDAIPAA